MARACGMQSKGNRECLDAAFIDIAVKAGKDMRLILWDRLIDKIGPSYIPLEERRRDHADGLSITIQKFRKGDIGQEHNPFPVVFLAGHINLEIFWIIRD